MNAHLSTAIGDKDAVTVGTTSTPMPVPSHVTRARNQLEILKETGLLCGQLEFFDETFDMPLPILAAASPLVNWTDVTAKYPGKVPKGLTADRLSMVLLGDVISTISECRAFYEFFLTMKCFREALGVCGQIWHTTLEEEPVTYFHDDIHCSDMEFSELASLAIEIIPPYSQRDTLDRGWFGLSALGVSTIRALTPVRYYYSDTTIDSLNGTEMLLL